MAKILKDVQGKFIDIHAHIFTKQGLESIKEEYGDRLYIPESNQIYDIKSRIRHMDENGIEIQTLSMAPRFYNLFYTLNSELSVDLARVQNDAIANIVESYPDRFVGLATIPLQHPREAVKELTRAVKRLNMTGIEIGSNINGKYLDDPDLWPFYEKVQRLGTFIFVHPINVAGLERMQKYHLRNLIGNPLDTSLAIASIIFGGVLESFPRLKFCFAHAGGFTPYQQGRLERGYHVRSECKAISKPPSEYVKLLYFDTITHYAPALSYLIENVGSDHVLMGSDYPFDMGDPNPVSTVKDLKTISNTEKSNVLGKNASRLLNLSPKG